MASTQLKMHNTQQSSRHSCCRCRTIFGVLLLTCFVPIASTLDAVVDKVDGMFTSPGEGTLEIDRFHPQIIETRYSRALRRQHNKDKAEDSDEEDSDDESKGNRENDESSPRRRPLPSIGPTTQPSEGPTTQPSVSSTTQPSVSSTKPSRGESDWDAFQGNHSPQAFPSNNGVRPASAPPVVSTEPPTTVSSIRPSPETNKPTTRPQQANYSTARPTLRPTLHITVAPVEESTIVPKTPSPSSNPSVDVDSDYEFIMSIQLSVAVLTGSECTCDIPLSAISDDTLYDTQYSVEAPALYAVEKTLEVVLQSDMGYFLHRDKEDIESPRSSLPEHNETKPKREEGHMLDEKGGEILVLEGSGSTNVTWIRTKVKYAIRSFTDLHTEIHRESGSASEDTVAMGNNIFIDDNDNTSSMNSSRLDLNFSLLETHRIQDEMYNVTFRRMGDGSLLQWLKKNDHCIINVTKIGEEKLVTDNGRPGKDFIFSELDTSWEMLQTLGSIMFALTFTATALLCLVARQRSKAHRALQWSAMIGSDKALNDLLQRTNQLLHLQFMPQTDDPPPSVILPDPVEWEDSLYGLQLYQQDERLPESMVFV